VYAVRLRKELHFLNNMPLATRALDGHPLLLSEAGGLQQLECNNRYLHVGGSTFTIGNRKRGDSRKLLFGLET
jgi:hypothetical protein